MGVLRAFGRWITDWRTGAVLLASLLAGAVIALVIVSGVQSHDALEARNRTAAAASRRIDLLNDQIEQLNAKATVNGERIGELIAQIGALQEQVRQMGGQPIVAVTTTTTPTGARPSSSTTTTTPRPPVAPAPTTTTTTPPRPCTAQIAGVCIGG